MRIPFEELDLRQGRSGPVETQAFDESVTRENVHDFPNSKEHRKEFVLFDELSDTSNKEWLVQGLLGAGEASACYGKPGSAKSALAEDMGLHVAAGWSWHGRKVKQGAVVYVALERRKLVERRGSAFRLKHSLKTAPFAIVGGVYDLRDRHTVDHLVQIIHDVEAATGQTVVLVIIDTLSRALCGGDENSPKDMGAIVNATSILQTETAAHVHWVHHTPLDGSDRLRGHTALLGAMDTTILVAKNGTLRTATVVKANDSEEDEQIAFRLESVTTGRNADGEITTAPVVCPVDNDGAMHSSATRKPDRLTKSAQIALNALAEVIIEQGAEPPASNHIPAGMKAVSVDAWRKHSYLRGISTGDDRAKQLAFQRASERLIGSSRVGTWDGLVWLA